MRQDETASTAAHSPLTPPPAPETPLPEQENASALSAKLAAELELERRERLEMTAQVRQMMGESRELTAEIRALTSENRQLWKENGELREKCARLEERQYQRSVSHGGGDAVSSA